MNDQEFGELRAMTDVIAADPRDMERVVGAMLDDRELSPVVKTALGRIRATANEAPFTKSGAKLVYAAEKLLGGRAQLEQDAGLALYSALSDYRERLDAAEALATRAATKNPLIRRFRRAISDESPPRARR